MAMNQRASGAIVIGRDYGALGVARSLGRKGIPVLLLEESRSNASVSRFVSKRMRWPGEDQAVEQLALLRSLADDHGLAGWTIFPTNDESVALISRHHAELSRRFTLTTPPWDIYRHAYDKRLTNRLADGLGIDHPMTVCPRDLHDLASRVWQFPVILKPAVKPKSNRLTTAKAWRANDRESLLARYTEAVALGEGDAVMVQELIPGGGETQLSFVALCADGLPLAWGAARRTRQHPIDFGKFSTFVETIDCPEIEQISRRLLAAMRHTGVVEIECKRDPRTGALKLLDINARYWAWHSLGKRAGAEFPYLQWRAVHGETFPEVRMRAGVRWMRGSADVLAAFRLIQCGELSFTAYLGSFRRPIEFAIFAFDDPAPFLADMPMMAKRWRLRRAGRRQIPGRVPDAFAEHGR